MRNEGARTYNNGTYFLAEIKDITSKTTHCLNCGNELRLKWEWVPESKVNQGYCCRKCYMEKPPIMAYLEQIYDKPVRELVIELLNKHSVTVASDMLGISRQSFYSYMAKLNIKRGRWE